MATPKSGANRTPPASHPGRRPRARSLTLRQVAEHLQVSEREVLPGPRGGDLRAAPDAEVSEERSYATEKKWSARQSILFVFVMSVVLWALIILGVRQIF